MNKQEILQQAKQIIQERRFQAEDTAQRTVERLRSNNDWNALDKQLRQAQVNLAMGVGDSDKLQKEISLLELQQQQLLAKLGLKTEDLKPRYSCHHCNDAGYTDLGMCKCLQEVVRNLIVADSNITNKEFTFENSTENDKHNRAVYKKAREICVEGNKNILLVGNTGSGKTYLLTACANLCTQLGKSVMFLTAYSLNSMFLTAHTSNIATCQAIMDSLTDVDVLVIDDLGTENIYKNVTAEYLFRVLNERIARKLPTFISSNLYLDVSSKNVAANTIRERYDERIYSRLIDQKTTFVAQLTGDDKRIKKSK